MVELVVIHAFDGYMPGERITDEEEIERILSGDNAASVNRVAQAE